MVQLDHDPARGPTLSLRSRDAVPASLVAFRALGHDATLSQGWNSAAVIGCRA
jgi:hypothetical protein